MDACGGGVVVVDPTGAVAALDPTGAVVVPTPPPELDPEQPKDTNPRNNSRITLCACFIRTSQMFPNIPRSRRL